MRAQTTGHVLNWDEHRLEPAQSQETLRGVFSEDRASFVMKQLSVTL